VRPVATGRRVSAQPDRLTRDADLGHHPAQALPGGGVLRIPLHLGRSGLPDLSGRHREAENPIRAQHREANVLRRERSAGDPQDRRLDRAADDRPYANGP
jgi:hypothetical protein